MRASILFGLMGLAMLGLAAHGALSGGVYAIARHGLHRIVQREQHFDFWFAVSSLTAAGSLFLAIAAFSFWGARAAKSAEARFFRQKQSLQPTDRP